MIARSDHRTRPAGRRIAKALNHRPRDRRQASRTRSPRTLDPRSWMFGYPLTFGVIVVDRATQQCREAKENASHPGAVARRNAPS